jgi:hypothetical protein
MPTVHQPTDTDPLPPQGTTPYLRRCAVLLEAARDEIARRRQLPGPLAA